MIGLFDVIDTHDNETYCVAKSCMVENIIGKFYIPAEYRDEVSKLVKGDIIFCVLDESSGFGAILYKQFDGLTENNAFKFYNDLTVGGNISCSNITAQNVVKGQKIVGSSLATFTLTLNNALCKAIVSAASDPTGTASVPVPIVTNIDLS